MNVTKSFRTAVLIGGMALTTAFLSGCGGLDEAQIKELSDLKSEVSSLEAEANSLRDQRTKLEAQVEETNRKLAECEKQKEEARANLEKLPK
jgi:septal ring factor EnvC (AmiA/AmiB activator)